MTAERSGSSWPKSRPVAAARRVGCGATTGRSSSAEVVQSWLKGTGSGSLYVARASPWQNGYAESFHSKVRDEFLNLEEFESEPQARALALWKGEYNTERPHSSLGYQTPAENRGHLCEVCAYR